ncbi:MAG TPA: T9SS type A sorting domain-containing protein [Bacteroidia bacterium]|jgi:polyhydroxybutyrate depolymerase|nr:T9SS type A sorting domain-containing protein [Bacteroidia bacterium]
MKKTNFIFCALLLVVLGAKAQTQVTIVDSILSGNIYRNFRLYIPKSYSVTTSSALVLDLHGYTSNAEQEQVYSNFKSISDTANFLIVYPNGTKTGGTSGDQFWNAGISPTLVNDVAFLSDLIDHIKGKYTIDANRVYACGMSNGGFMSHTLACALNYKIAAIASVTGSMFVPQYSTCVPNRVVPVLQIHGTADQTVPYTGNSSMVAIDSLMKFWVKHDQCDLIPVIDSVPDINKADSCTAVHYVFKNGRQGSTCELYKIIRGGHSWPGALYKIAVTNQDFNASEKIWQFFSKYKLSDMLTVPEQENELDAAMYPNPCVDKLNIEVLQLTKVSIFDVTGKVVLQSTQSEIDVRDLAKGLYFVHITTKNGETVKRLVK